MPTLRLAIRWHLFLGIAAAIAVSAGLLVLIAAALGPLLPEGGLSYLSLAAVSVALVLVALLAAWLLGTPYRRRLAALAAAMRRLAGGDLSVRLDWRHGGAEIEQLGRAFDEMASELELRVDELARSERAGEAVEGELRAARKIQASLLPQRWPAYPERRDFNLHGVTAAARYVGGDFFDFFLLSPRELVLVVADVSGRGVPAAMFMAVSRTIVHNLARQGLAPREIVAGANRLLVQERVGSTYVTLFVAKYDTETGALAYANAAHPSPLVVSAEGEVRTLGGPTGTLVGMLPDAAFDEREAILGVGELLVMYTDGVLEARSPTGAFYGDREIVRLLGAYADAPPHFLCDLVVREVNAFQGGNRTDDLTLLMLRRLARSRPPRDIEER